MIIDSHCHLNYEPLSENLDETILRANNEGVKFLLTISTEDKSYQQILNIVNKYKCVYGTYGIHPHEAKNHKNITSELIQKSIKKNNKIIGIGETGLDFYYNHSEKKEQIKCFLEHIDASQNTKLPIIVHTRSAEEETLKILKEAKSKKDFKILIHCLADTFKQIPENRILVETDSPYLAPIPFRGKPNEPSYIKHTVKFLSELKNKPYETFSEITTRNFFNLFGDLN